MNNRARAVISWGTFTLVAVLAVVVAVKTLIDQGVSIPLLLNSITAVIFLVLSVGIGALIISNQPRNTIGWLFIFYPIVWAVTDTLAAFIQIPAGSRQISIPVFLYEWMQGWSWWLVIAPIFLIPLLFPNGKLLSPAWRWVIVVMAACFAVFIVILTFSPTITDINHPQIEFQNPIGWLPHGVVNLLMIPFAVLLGLTAILSVASIFIRYRRAAGQERQQMKWLVYGFGVFLLIYLATYVGNLADNDWSGVLMNAGMICFAAAIGAAILRYRLFDIDVIIRRTLIYGSLTLLLGAVFFTLVVALQQFFVRVTGQENPVALVIATVVIVLLFNWLRLRVQEFIDRRFYRARYDANRLVIAFSEAARDEVDLYVLAEKLQSITQQAVNPKTISFWIQEADE